MAPAATVARAMRCLYVDLDGPLLGPGGSLLRGGDGRFSLDGVRALQACDRADVEVVLYSGRRRSAVFENARVLGHSSYIFEIGCGLVVDGELEWLTDGVVPSDDAGSIFEQITASGAPALLLDRYQGSLEYHTPWAIGRDVSHLFRGNVDPVSVNALLASSGFGWLRLVDNGTLEPGLQAYHLIPSGASKARAVARHMQARGYVASDCIAVGDSREDMDAAGVVGTFWLVANALERDPSLGEEVVRRAGVRVAEGAYGTGVYAAVVTTMAERR
jgi:hydroxymethylpyrimidine pyrophosphatase-like HAD family hydrolase